jgi:MoaA/NifB/PqqE/SkfB family radical SAM enzyme
LFPEQLAVFLTFKCNFECDHCSVNCGPKRKEVLDLDTLKSVLDQAYYIPSLRVVVFTGGDDPTLYLNRLRQAIAYATEKGFITRLITNAWWAHTISKAEETLGELHRNGLAEINISYDDFHAPYLARYGGEQNVINVIEAASKLKMTILIGAVVFPGAKIRTEYLRKMVKKIGVQEVLYMEDFFNRLGRAKTKIPDYLFAIDKLDLNQISGCTEAGRILAVTADGKIAMCCGHALLDPEVQDMFILGRANEANLCHMIKSMERNVFYWWLHVEGPRSILRQLNVESQERPCEACYLLGSTYRSKLLALAAKKEDIFAKLVEGESASIST